MEELTAKLTARLRREMARDGVIPFRRFMELSLYCPETGYYERSAQHVGRRGDFMTSVSSGPLFGRLLAAQFARWCENISGPVTIIEAGAHDGQLARDILEAIHREHPTVATRLEYCLLESSPTREAWQRATLSAFNKVVRWIPGVEQLPPDSVQGVIFANELLDAFPVHRLTWDAGRQLWLESGVRWNGTEFGWCPLPPGDVNWDRALQDAGMKVPPALKAVIPDGFTIEFSPEAGAWWRTAGEALKTGMLLTLDYGFAAQELLSPARSNGTLRAYSRHTVSPDVLARPGEQDITAHVNFSQLQDAGERSGLTTVAFQNQTEFLTQIASRLWTDASPPNFAEIRQFRTLTHPEHLGRAFRVLIQSRALSL